MAMLLVAAVLSSLKAGELPATIQPALQQIAGHASDSSGGCGVSIAVHKGGQTITATAGAAGPERTVAPEDTFAWGSGTKPLTGASILKLISEGHFGLDDPISPLIDPFLKAMAARDPSLPFSSLASVWGAENMSKTTVRDLLSMRSGVPDFDTANGAWTGNWTDTFRRLAYARPAHVWTPWELINLPWVRTFGAHGYSTTNFMLLGFILAAHANATSWLALDQSAVVPSTNLRAKLQFGRTGTPKQLSTVHGFDRTLYNQPPNHTADFDVSDQVGVFAGWTGSDLVASAAAVAELADAIYGPAPSVLPKQYADLMGRHGCTAESYYGLATFCLNHTTGQGNDYGEAWGHEGDTYGFTSRLAFSPSLNFTIAVATNVEGMVPALSYAFCASWSTVAGALLGKAVTCDFAETRAGCRCTPLAPSPSPPPPMPMGSCCWGLVDCSLKTAASCPLTNETRSCQSESSCTGACGAEAWCP
jgi:CubicO group peptidase (beta-lactamase class C family)